MAVWAMCARGRVCVLLVGTDGAEVLGGEVPEAVGGVEDGDGEEPRVHDLACGAGMKS
jgi:hypothetical protein